ncbi:nucleoside-diphosphate-sugar epimerase [Kribbella rubisoli]|uniref:Nucleoside-diphosphate-sugar epimerase n=1 Tax=Kribbella rubisoli TaxID=3075929 RepID=A0A4Q7XAL7_9ACTN|nr:NAD-dependent epimerase/dehydratase family protein [Kribbella rubisoli]RZU19853.1 nucleoside-diphosphate-sugar epimerase [Kribbella rubisoli]
MRTVVIGGTGHIGTYLVPALIRLGHQVTVLSRGERTPYHSDGTWRNVTFLQADRAAEDAAGTFGSRVAGLDPDIVIDLICFTEDSARQLVEALEGKVQHLLHCGTIWVHGPSAVVPTREDAPRRPFGDYGIQKAAIEDYLLAKARRDQFPVTIVHPGHICGPGWTPVNPAGNFNLDVYQSLAKGAAVQLPNLGLETLNPVHADDVAGVFLGAIASRATAIGESFHAVATDAVTLRGYAEAVAERFGQDAQLSFVPIDRLREELSQQDGQATWDHVLHSPNCSMAKAERLLGFRPRYSAIEAAMAGIDWLVENGKVT